MEQEQFGAEARENGGPSVTVNAEERMTKGKQPESRGLTTEELAPKLQEAKTEGGIQGLIGRWINDQGCSRLNTTPAAENTTYQ